MWFHTTQSSGSISKIYIILAGSVFLMIKLVGAIMFLLSNYKRAPIELIVRKDGNTQDPESSLSENADTLSQIVLRLTFSGHMNIKAGQHISLYIPSLTGFRGHLLPISWWDQDRRTSIDIILDSGHELAQTLVKYDNSSPRAYFTGPHGSPTVMDDYGTVLLFATGHGISTQLSHVKQLIKERDNGTSRTRHIHLIWQLETWGDRALVVIVNYH